MPSLRISGGNKEVVRLVQELLEQGGTDAVIACMWKHPHEVETNGIPVIHLSDTIPVRGSALGQLPGIALGFRRLIRRLQTGAHGQLHLLLGHYSTYLAVFLAPLLPRICFNQDMEWLFVRQGWKRSLLKRAILLTNRRSCVVTTNEFVTESYRANGVQPFGEASIWAEPRWLATSVSANRHIDVLMLLRGSGIKRLDLAREALSLFQARTRLRVAVITPDTAIADSISGDLAQVFLRPSDDDMEAIFARSRVFLLLSDVEGFGLPPLEAMGSGCVPVCRDSGGVRCYMHGEFHELLFPLDRPVEEIVDAVAERVRSGSLPTSAAAQQAFRDGLQASRASREDCLRRLHQMLCGPPTD